MNALTIERTPPTRGEHGAAGFEAGVIALTGEIARRHHIPAEVGIDFDGSSGIRRDLEPEIHQLIESTCDALLTLAEPAALRIGLGFWGEHLNAIIWVDGVAHAPVSTASPELCDVRDIIDGLRGAFDVSEAAGLTVRAVLPVSRASDRRSLSASPPGVDRNFARDLTTDAIGRHLTAAAAGLGLPDEAIDRINWRAALLTPAAGERAVLRVGVEADHALLLVETKTRVLAFWEPWCVAPELVG